MASSTPTRLYPRPLPTRARLALWLHSGATALKGELGLLLALLLVAFVAHGFNMFNLPAFTHNGDEGIYTGQALAVLNDGKLAPYTYWYDHAPAGWIFLAAWVALSGGPLAFGSPIDSGRVLMLLLHLAMVHRLYCVARKLGCGPAPAAFAVLLFSLSPLAIFYQRPVMLDNLMLFWVLISLDLLLDGQGRLSRVALSGFCFGLALLTKETAVFLLPAMLFIAIRERREHHGRFAVGGWLLPMAIVTSWYPLYALLKGELLPVALSARLFGETEPHVSLLDTLLWQMGRKGGGMFNLDNQFWHFLRDDWLVLDPLLVLGGVTAVVLNLLLGAWAILEARNKEQRTKNKSRALYGGPSVAAMPSMAAMTNHFAAALLGLLPLYYMARGGLVFNFYIVFAVPFFCLNLAILLNLLAARLSFHRANALVIVLVGLALGYWWGTSAPQLYTERPSEAGRAAISWIRQNLPPDSTIVADDAFWPDLRSAAPGMPGFPNVHSHWKAGGDPEVGIGIFQNDWRNVDYLIMTPGLERNFEGATYPVAKMALEHARPIQRWQADGALVELWQVDTSATQ
jgi:4-amino-4-deoxy-L-arabinose transferase-like glycosyltransferase